MRRLEHEGIELGMGNVAAGMSSASLPFIGPGVVGGKRRSVRWSFNGTSAMHQ
jgi:hypothetical protein